MNTTREQKMNAKFSNSTTSTAFNLSLSKHMIEALLAIRDFNQRYSKAGYTNDPEEWRWAPDNVTGDLRTRTSLLNRGLIKTRTVVVPSSTHPRFSSPHFDVALTKAGQLVCSLLAEAGFLSSIV